MAGTHIRSLVFGALAIALVVATTTTQAQEDKTRELIQKYQELEEMYYQAQRFDKVTEITKKIVKVLEDKLREGGQIIPFSPAYDPDEQMPYEELEERFLSMSAHERGEAPDRMSPSSADSMISP